MVKRVERINRENKESSVMVKRVERINRDVKQSRVIVKKMKKAQNLLEYILIFALVAIMGYVFFANFDLKKMKNYVFGRPSDSATETKIEAMTP